MTPFRGIPILVVLAGLSACRTAAHTAQTGNADPLIAPGESLYTRGEFDSARALWRTSLAAPGVAGTPREARLDTWLGLAAYRLGEYPEARRTGEQGLDLATRLGLDADRTRAQNALGLLAWAEGRLGDAADLFTQALAGYRTLGDAAGIARASSNLGLVRYDLGRFDEARDAWLLARDTARALHNALIEGRALSNLGMWEIWAGEPSRAPDVLSQARARSASVDDVVGLESALGQTGVAHMVLGEPGLALAALDSAIAVARAHGMRDEEANDLVVVAEIYADAGNADQALREFAQARQINQDLGLTIETGSVLREEASIRAARGALDRAREDVRQAIDLHRSAEASREEFLDHLVLADVERRAAQPAAAQRGLADARRLASQLGSVDARVSLALAEARVADDAGDAHRTLSVVATIQSDLPQTGPGTVAEAHALRMHAWTALGMLDSAAAAGHRAIDAIEQVRDGFASGPLRTSYVADRSKTYADLVLVLLRLGRTDDAFAVADEARGRAIVEHLSAARGAVRQGRLEDLTEAERLLRRIDQLLKKLAEQEEVPPHERSAAYASISKELMGHLEQARSEYQELMVRVAESAPDRQQLIGGAATSVPAVQAALAADEAMVEYLVTADRLFVFTVTRDSIRVSTRDVSQEALTHQVQLARELLTTLETKDREHGVTQSLYEALLGPVKEGGALANVHRLFVVPHGALSYLPFAALQDSATGRILADEVAVAYLPTAGALPLFRGVPARSTSGAVGFAPFPDRLPSTEAEVGAFRGAVPHASVRTGRGASESAVRRALADGKIVHVATHGVMNARNPLFSRVELAPGRGGPADDGRLEVHELLDLTITSPLVFLSGCQTALGSAWTTAFDQGEDYATLAQAFLYAGAGVVVATLWRIDDAGAAAFAERFYQHLRTGPADEALAAAQRDLRADSRWRSPYYWAGYTLSGAGAEAAAQTRRPVAVQR